MPYSEKLATRIREALADLPNVEEKKMFRGITFMVNGKMCVSVSGENMMCRFDPALHAAMAKKKGFKTVMMRGREYKGFGYISPEVLKPKREFDFWINLALDFNKKAKPSKRKNTKNHS